MNMSRRVFLAGAGTLVAAGSLVLAGCGGSQQSGPGQTVKIGTMPTEDILPMWVAEQEGLFKENGVEAEVVVFDSAQNLSAAITAGEVDYAMTDPMRAIKLCESGTEVTMEWITLGANAEQGRFGVLASSDAEFKSLKEMASFNATADFATEDYVGVALASNTVPEYVFEMLCEQEGVDPESLRGQEIPSLPDRYAMVAEGKVEAAALPGSLLALGEASGMTVIADDTKSKTNISQSVMVVRKEFNTMENSTNMIGVQAAWDAAATKINANPESYRDLLVEKANLNSKVAETYPISEYPMATGTSGEAGSPAYPPAELIEPQIEWMAKKGYSTKKVTYNEADGSFTCQ